MFVWIAVNKEKDMDGKVCKKSPRRKRTIQNNISPALSQNNEVDPGSSRPRTKKQCKGEKASVRMGKISVALVQGEQSCLILYNLCYYCLIPLLYSRFLFFFKFIIIANTGTWHSDLTLLFIFIFFNMCHCW